MSSHLSVQVMPDIENENMSFSRASAAARRTSRRVAWLITGRVDVERGAPKAKRPRVEVDMVKCPP